jgi:hypothetical protein
MRSIWIPFILNLLAAKQSFDEGIEVTESSTIAISDATLPSGYDTTTLDAGRIRDDPNIHYLPDTHKRLRCDPQNSHIPNKLKGLQ